MRFLGCTFNEIMRPEQNCPYFKQDEGQNESHIMCDVTRFHFPL